MTKYKVESCSSENDEISITEPFVDTISYRKLCHFLYVDTHNHWSSGFDELLRFYLLGIESDTLDAKCMHLEVIDNHIHLVAE